MKLLKDTNLQSLNYIFGRSFKTIFGSSSKITRVLYRMFNLFERELRSNGPKHTIARFKFLENLVLQNLLGTPLSKHKYWTSLDEAGFPKKLGIPKGELSVEDKRAILTVMSYYRQFILDVNPDIQSIVTPQTTEVDYALIWDLREFAEEFFNANSIKPFEPVDQPPIYGTTKAGANGPKAMGVSSLIDLVALGEIGVSRKIISVIEAVYTESRIDEFFDMIDDCAEHIDDSVKEKAASNQIGRLHFIAEAAGKTRCVAIPTIWHQSALKPVHNYLMGILKGLPGDMTYRQDDVSFIKEITKTRGMFCYDLTAATDRLPLNVQREVLRPILGDLTDMWSELISSSLFRYKDQDYGYAVGQPMGLLTSWPAMALTHHIIIQYCVQGLDNPEYVVLGDDMAMSSEEGSQKYLDIMDRLGVEISLDKSFVPSNASKRNTTKAHAAEFAKRVFQNGHEISRIPPSMLRKATSDLQSFIELANVLAVRTNQNDADATSIGEGLARLWKHNRDASNPTALSFILSPLSSALVSTQCWQVFQARLMEQSVTSYTWGGLQHRELIWYWKRFLEKEAQIMMSRWRRRMLECSAPSWFSDQMDGVTRLDSATPTPILSKYLTYTGRELTEGVNAALENKQKALTDLELFLRILEKPDEFDTSSYMKKYQIDRQRTMERIHNFRRWLNEEGVINVQEHDFYFLQVALNKDAAPSNKVK